MAMLSFPINPMQHRKMKNITFSERKGGKKIANFHGFVLGEKECYRQYLEKVGEKTGENSS